ncbi:MULTISPECIES: heme ABC transporter ATP-binding protein [Brevibacillus]|jgi:ABC-type cobalamin/Fe3+-siderophores transport systems, ATPase components|uniref:ABC transporter n=1 Tax=Brevibacillus parabrevis TaxID=54914 RepID=A0A4Y3PEC6_BREPA|nr:MULTISPECIES: heme ABC transporter ATP-binding protein [Brevibacillus]MBU8714939.1 heme ABC transporter ATP-binding protein [Brevibacillus parabrevis]MDR5000798.1 heme ABC transporter ATP-binding protein [Brevibacillus parabrevis]MED2253095.1 heme ABC transporter ATP-binding protein [Brevibacillus parabrevis]NRQ55453.1 heme ABC transporter ATP-binding protein [Brevibacillus sp. HD1.4A]RNB95281.1 heme ABC transporter ATP-binding protein [Brevibacillus parabrevis]
MNLNVENITVGLENKTILHNVSLTVRSGEFVGLIGPNGSGKSTLLKSIYRVLKPYSGLISLDDDNVYQLSARQNAQRMAVVRQESSVEFDFTVMEIVMMGRSPHKRLFQTDTTADSRICEESLERVGMQAYAERSFFSLSGGEKQRVLIARALVQQAEFLVLDEPTNHLDVRYQLQVMDLVKTLGITVFSSLHDLNIAAMYCDRLYVIRDGELVASGTPDEVLEPGLIRDVFGVETEVITHPRTGKKHVYFFSEALRNEQSRQEVKAL